MRGESTWLGGARGGVVGIVQRVIDALGMYDYAATVKHTDGSSIYSDSVTALVEGAEKNRFYPVLTGPQVESFAKYLPVETTTFDVGAGYDFAALYGFRRAGARRNGGPRQGGP